MSIAAATLASIVHPSMIYGSLSVPLPDTTPFAGVKFASPTMTIGAWGAPESV